jgi:hypothetical protein
LGAVVAPGSGSVDQRGNSRGVDKIVVADLTKKDCVLRIDTTVHPRPVNEEAGDVGDNTAAPNANLGIAGGAVSGDTEARRADPNGVAADFSVDHVRL